MADVRHNPHRSACPPNVANERQLARLAVAEEQRRRAMRKRLAERDRAYEAIGVKRQLIVRDGETIERRGTVGLGCRSASRDLMVADLIRQRRFY